jgi:hypothetical protein
LRIQRGNQRAHRSADFEVTSTVENADVGDKYFNPPHESEKMRADQTLATSEKH